MIDQKFVCRVFRISQSVALATVLITFANCSEKDSDNGPTNDPKIPDIAPTDCDFSFDEAGLTSKGWTKAFEENFDGDLSKWNIWTGGAFNNELEYYQEANLVLKDGVLSINAKKEAVTGNVNPWDETQKDYDFTSGRIESKTLFSAGAATPKVRIVARIKLPAGTGLWPAFWSYGDPWPTQGEIDFLEARGSETKKYQTNYFYGTSANNNLVTGAEKIITADADLTTCYHVYEMIWEQSKLTSVLDGTTVEVKTSGNYIPQLFEKQERIVLNLAVGGLFFQDLDPNTIQPGTMQIDWVKVYTSN